MKQLLLICAAVALLGCGKKPLTKEESAKVMEAAIRKSAKKPTGELTKADYEEVTELTEQSFYNKQLTDVKSLEKLTQLDAAG